LTTGGRWLPPADLASVEAYVEWGYCRPLHSTSFTTGTRPVGSIGQAWQPPADLVSVGANVKRGVLPPHHSTSFTTGTRPVGSTGQMWQPPADLVSVGANVKRGVLPPHHSTSFTTGTRPVGSTGQMWQPPADLASVGANVEWGAVVRSTQLPSPPVQDRWDRLVEANVRMARLDIAALCAWSLIIGAACFPLAGACKRKEVAFCGRLP
jgi:hypothetical protein